MIPRLHKNTHGFTLVELLCVIAIIGILLAMILPAVQSVREAARSVSCKNKLRQLAMATLQFEGSRYGLPPGTLGFDPTPWIYIPVNGQDFYTNENFPFFLAKNQNTSWLAFLLPFLEQGAIDDRLLPIALQNSSDYLSYRQQFPSAPVWIFQLTEIENVMQERIDLFLCPSDNLADDATATLGGGQPIYHAPTGQDFFVSFPIARSGQDDQPLLAGMTNYQGCSGAFAGGDNPLVEVARYDGAFESRRLRKISDFTDGLSNSVMIGESLGQIQDQERVFANTWLFASMARGRSDFKWKTSRPSGLIGLEMFGDAWVSSMVGFGSKHPTIVSLARADGGVNSISRELDIPTWYALCGITDGDVVGSF